MRAPRTSRPIARLGGVVVALLVVASLGVIVVSFVGQQRDRIATVHAEQDGIRFARPVVELLDRLARARVAAAQTSAGDYGARYRYGMARRQALRSLAELGAMQRSDGRKLGTATEVAELRRTVDTLLPHRADGGMAAQRAFSAITHRTTRLLARIGDGSQLVLDSQAETYALVDAAVTQLPILMDVGGRALALSHLAGGRSTRELELAVAKGTVQASLGRLRETLGQSHAAAVDDDFYGSVQAPLAEVTADMTSLTRDLTAAAGGPSPRAAAAPVHAYALWNVVADHLDAQLQRRGAALERRQRLVAGAAALLLALALGLFAASRHDRRRSEALADQLGLRDSVLHETQARYRALVEQLPAVTYVLESDHVVYVSPKLAPLLGHEPEQWLADPELWLRSVHPDDRAAAQAGRLAAAETATSTEYRLIALDGRELWVRDEAAPVRDDDGRLLYVQGMLLDVTDRRRAEEERDGMELELQVASKLEAVGQLAAGVAHEINTPIQFVGDSVRFLNDAVGDLFELVGTYRAELTAAGDAVDATRVADAEEHADLAYLQERMPVAFERTFDGVGRVSTIVSAMKSFSHTTGTEMGKTDLNEGIRTTLVVCANEYKYVADLATDYADLPDVTCHIGDLNQVFLNLVVNAAHAIEDAGDARGTIAVSTARDGGDVVITVSDTGSGIPDDVRERIFEPFYTTKQVGRGSGQGLALARSIVVDKHGGSIDVQTTVGEGTAFTVRLPISGR